MRRPALLAALGLSACEVDKTIYRVPERIPGLGWDLDPDVEEGDDGSSEDGGDTGGPVTDCAQAGTWATVGQPLALSWCTGCHSSHLSGAARHGAPEAVQLDSLAGFLEHADRSRARIAAGTMPPGGGIPAVDQRRLEQWLDCGAEGDEARLDGPAEPWGPTDSSTVRVQITDTGGGSLRLTTHGAQRFGELLFGRYLVEEMEVAGPDAWLVGWRLEDGEGAFLRAESFDPPLPLTGDAEGWTATTRVTIETPTDLWEEDQEWTLSRAPAAWVDGRAPDPAPERLIALEAGGAEQGWDLSPRNGLTARWAFDADGAGFVRQQDHAQPEGSWTGFPVAGGDDWRGHYVVYGERP